MKVAIGFNLQPGAWGGGNQFGKSLTTLLRQKGISVFFDLKEPDLDIILLTEPRAHLRSSAFTDREILRYLLLQNKEAIVVHRINECDERKNSSDVNKILIRANQTADHTVFVSGWLRTLFASHNLTPKRSSVIFNGSDRSIFHPQGFEPWNGTDKLKIVTHHWGAHWLKGFDIYQQLDQLLATEPYRSQLSFTYIGNLPQGFTFQNSRYLPPQSGEELANTIRQHHLYLTASMFEPGGNHQNEGANCGLPLLYRESGCMPEYCKGFGISYNSDNFPTQLQQMINEYPQWVVKMDQFPLTAERCAAQYLALFHQLLSHKSELIADRQWSTTHWIRALSPNSALFNRAQSWLKHKLG